MFRRRAFRHFPMRLLRVAPPKPLTTLIEANRLKDSGHPLRAAVIYERLAQLSITENRLRNTPFLLLQAGECYLIGQDFHRGYDLIRQGLKTLADAGRWNALSKSGNSAIDRLEVLGYAEAGRELRAWLEQVLKPVEDLIRRTPTGVADPLAADWLKKNQRIPTKCPCCGANMRSNEVEWIDNVTVECVYCGSPVAVNQEK